MCPRSVHRAWMSQPCCSCDVDMASTSLGPGTAVLRCGTDGAGVTKVRSRVRAAARGRAPGRPRWGDGTYSRLEPDRWHIDPTRPRSLRRRWRANAQIGGLEG